MAKISWSEAYVPLSRDGKNPDEIPKELFSFLTFIRENQPDDTKDYNSRYVKQLQKSIEYVKTNREMGLRYMQLQKMLRDEFLSGEKKGLAEGLAKGLAEGKKEGLAEGILNARIEDILALLEDLGKIPDTLRSIIQGEKDLARLKSMHKAASRAESIEDFVEAVKIQS